MPSQSVSLSAFGRAIRELRQAQGISQEELGYRSGLDRTYVGGIERGERNPTLWSMLRLAGGLEVPVSLAVERFERLLEEAEEDA